MTAAIICLTVLVLAVLVSWGRMAEKWAEERAMLLVQVNRMADRIQHPEVRQVEAVDPVAYDPPKDLAEMAFVGQEVPYGYDVGTDG